MDVMRKWQNMSVKAVMVNSNKERLSREQIEVEIPLTTVRGSCETVFKRIVNEEFLHENSVLVDSLVASRSCFVAHGEANLCKPLRTIG